MATRWQRWTSAVARGYRPHLALFVVALALRVAWVLIVQRNGLGFNDALMYHGTAENILSGRGWELPFTPGPTAQWPPGYTLTLVGTYQVFGVSEQAAELVNAVLGALTVVVLMLAVERIVNRTTALVAGAILAVLPGPILWTEVLVSETLFTLVVVVMLLALSYARDDWRWAVVFGLVIGTGAMVRGEAITWLLFPVVLFWGQIPRLAIARRLGLVVLAAAVVMAPWTIRNYAEFGEIMPVGANAGRTLWSGHHPDATGAQTYPTAADFERLGLDADSTEIEISDAFRDDGIDFLLDNPVRELELIPLKIIHLNRGDSYVFDWINAHREEPAVSDIDVERVGTIADAGYFALLALTLLGAVMLGGSFWRKPACKCIAAGFLTLLFLYGFVYYGNYRYRLPYEPLMVVVAATLLVRMWHGVRTPTDGPGSEQLHVPEAQRPARRLVGACDREPHEDRTESRDRDQSVTE